MRSKTFGPIIDHGGYVSIVVGNIRRREHRVVVEKHLGRELKETECVHHKNKNKLDNRVENLMVFSNRGAHMTYDRIGYIDSRFVVFDGGVFNGR